MKSNQLQKSNLWSLDLLNSEGIKLFYQTKETIYAYCIGESIGQRRQISLQVAEVLNFFLNYQFTNEEINFIKDLFTNNSKILKKLKKIDNRLVSRLKSLNPKGFDLLEIKENIDISILKSLYRRASKKYHPDLGGSVQKMQMVNEAFTIFHEAITNYFPLDDFSEDRVYVSSSPETWEELIFSVHLTLACLYGDLFAADKSYEHIVKAYNYAVKCNNNYIGQFIGNLIDFGNVLDRTCRVLGRFNMKDELIKAAKITSYYLDRYIKDWAPKYEDDYKPERNDYPTVNDLINELGVKIVITHLEQAKNAFRLGKIDELRYLKTMKRFNARIIDEKEVISKINEFIDKCGFIPKVSNTNYYIKSINPKIIISPSYFQDRFDFLEDEQKWEYLYTFINKNTANNFNKYYYLRTQEILLGLVNNYENLDLVKLKKEIQFFIKNFQNQYNRYFLLNEFYIYLSELGNGLRKKKLKLLTEIDDPNPISFTESISLSITLDGVYVNKPEGGYKKRIQLDNEYIEFAKMDFEKIKDYQNSGKINNEYENAWNNDLDILNKFEKSSISKKREKILIYTKSPSPEMVINSSEPYINELLKIGEKFHPKNTGELQIGYEINRVTTAYGKLKKWDKVIYWGELFFNLPQNYRDRCTLSEQESIKKRIERAKLQLN